MSIIRNAAIATIPFLNPERRRLDLPCSGILARESGDPAGPKVRGGSANGSESRKGRSNRRSAARTTAVGLRRSLLTLALLGGIATAANAQTQYFFGAGESFDPAIPTPAEFLGYEIGTHHTRHDQIVAYLKELARLSKRASYQEIGRTFEHRPLAVLTITAPENQAALETIRLRHLGSITPGAPIAAPIARTGDRSPNTASPGLATVAAPTLAPARPGELPVIVHLGYGVHGNETSSSEAALLTAYWLVARQGPEHERYLAEGVFHLEPTLNPDGRDRHTFWANSNKATPFVADPLDREHNEVWPGGRTNHYWFDLNRDWLPLVNPESRARIDFHQDWRPNVVTDFHEMGTNSTYYFEPSEPRATWNPLIPERLYTEITEDFARHYAAALDEIGSLYFTKEQFDNSYPGYGSTYPKFLGGFAITFEQASARGHLQESTHHGQLTFAFAIRNHLRTSLATIRGALEYRVKLQEYQRDFFASALREAERFPVKAYIFGDPVDATRNRAFLDLLLRHRLEVYEAPRTIAANGHTFRPGAAWIVPTTQPQYRLVRSLFERTSEYADSVFYDASTWTTSLAYGLPDAELRGRPTLGARVTAVPEPAGLGAVPRSGYAYLLDWSDYAAPRALYYLLARGIRAEAAFAPFTARTNEGERSYGRGTISIPVRIQEVDDVALHRLILEAERAAGVRFQSVATGYSLQGIDLGSRQFQPVTAPRAALIVGDGIASAEAGQIWHLLDTRVALPVTKLDRRDFPRADLDRYDALILPSGDYSFISGEKLEELKRWIRRGGTLIALRTAAAWAARNGLTPSIDAPQQVAAGGAATAAKAAEVVRRDYADTRARQGAQRIGGSIWEVDLDITHPLGFGYQNRRLPVWRDHSLFFPPSRNPHGTVARLTAEPHLSGYISAPNLERLRGSPSLLADKLGRGSVVLMLDNPNFRGYWYGTNRLFLNALFFGRQI